MNRILSRFQAGKSKKPQFLTVDSTTASNLQPQLATSILTTTITTIAIPVPSDELQGTQPEPNGDNPSVPPSLAAIDITSQVTKSEPTPFVGLYFHTYQGIWKVNSPTKLQRGIAIRSLRPGFHLRKQQEQQDFESMLNECIIAWSKLDHENVVPLLGISMAFGQFPAMVTSWMNNGLLTEYLSKESDCDKMKLIIDVGRGLAYLHSQNIVHSNLRATTILVDGLHNARLADPGLLHVLQKGSFMASGEIRASYRWMAPELLDDPERTSFSSDVYAFTMTCLEIYTGHPPFANIRFQTQVTDRIHQGQRPDRPDSVPHALWLLWNAGWNKYPAKRPDMQSYVKRLEELA